MKNQIVYNFAKLTGETNSKPHKQEQSKRVSQEKMNNMGLTRNSHRILKPTGITRVKKDDYSSSRSSLQSVSSKQSLKQTLKTSRDKPVIGDVDNAEEFFNNFESDYVIKYSSIKRQGKPLKRSLLKQFQKEGGRSSRHLNRLDLQCPTLKINELKCSLGSSSRQNSCQKNRESYHSQSRMSMKQIQAKYKQSQQKILKIRQKVNQLYRLNSQSSEKELRSINIGARSRPKYQHRLLY